MNRVGVIGLGHWGPNLVRNFSDLPDTEVAFCDADEKRLRSVASRFPQAQATTDPQVILQDNRMDAVAIATPTSEHYQLAKSALERGLHTFVEKPLAKTSEQCADLISLAEEKGVVLFVGHVFLYNSAVIKLKELVDSGELGDLCYVSSMRRSLGPVRKDVNSLWDLAPHCISILLYILGREPTDVNCTGLAFLNKKVHDVTTAALHFENGALGFTHCSWIDPKKIRQVTVVGSKKMAVYDDVEPLEKIKIYDRGVEGPPDYDTFGEYQLSYRYGDTYIPKIDQLEPLKVECQHFLDCIRLGMKPKTDGRNGLDVVRVLEAAERSLQGSGERISLEPSPFGRELETDLGPVVEKDRVSPEVRG